MAARSLEERIKLLEEINEKQQKKLQYLEDIHEIQNLTSRYQYLMMASRHDETLELWAKKTPGVGFDTPSFGYYKGYEGVRRYIMAFKRREGDGKGKLNLSGLTTPVIEVAGDGKTAKGVWTLPGLHLFVNEGKPKAYKGWMKYGIDFVKEDGEWKLWHLRVYGIFMEKEGVEPALTVPAGFPPIPSDELKADKYTTERAAYSPTGETELIPVPPEPYETWDESMSYIEDM